ncbi:MAG TPA: tRNA dihydrouridine synthase DusB [Gammaproteobacteria bacterium]|nr:tRNA-dihydrouridine synthase C [bacterium BMS3Abin11]HDH17140.1 tRNA dihydrouridine synthase DusB [Gammaproteobacteria bacterium]
MQIGPHILPNQLVLAPMAGISDRPFRKLCRSLGAGMAVSEMINANALVWENKKTRQRINHEGEPGPVVVQIAGADPDILALAAQENVRSGADIIDINMGCPAKKVCNKQAGSALLANEDLVSRILDKVVNSVEVPVTLKIRTGTDPDSRNACRIAEIAELSGVQSLAVHGRTRKCAFRGEAEYETIRLVKQQVNIPVIANGDISSPEKAAEVLAFTGADGLMIGRPARGNPWIFSQINHYLQTGRQLSPPAISEVREVLLTHLQELYDFYGEHAGVRIARKHIAWYSKGFFCSNEFRREIMQLESSAEQLAKVELFLTTADLRDAVA